MNEIVENFHLMRPEWLWGLLPGLLLTVLLWQQRGRSGSWSNVIAPELLPFLIGEQQQRQQRNFLPVLLIAWLLACLAAAGPSWQKIPQPVIQKQDALVMVFDLSLSMKAADLAPSRVDRARQKLLDLLAERKEGQTGLIAFAGDSHIVTPLTDDNPTIANLLPALHPDMMPLAGSDAVAAVDQAQELLQSAGVRGGRILLVTDEVGSDQHQAIAEMLAGSGTEISILGIGTATGAPIPLPRGGFLKDSAGTIVVPGMDSDELRKLAALTGGRYSELRIDNSDLRTLLQDKLLVDDEQTLALDRTADAWEDQGHWLIVLLLPLALSLFRRGWLICLLPLLTIIQPQPAQAQTWDALWATADQRAQRALREGNHEAAAELFENRDWAGTAAYRGQDYATAVEKFDNDTSADSWYNRGNALARSQQFDEAIAAYRESLALAPERTDALENIALLEELQKQQEQQQQQNQDAENQDQQNQQNQQDQDQQQQDQQNQQGDEQDASQQEREQDQQQNPSQQDEQEEQEASESEDQGEEEESEKEKGEQEQPSEPEQPDPEAEPEEQQVAQAEPSAEDQEREQAMEQWLRRVPDDPSGLLREKFRYESRQRQSQENRTNNDRTW